MKKRYKTKKVHSTLDLNCKKGNAITDTITYGVLLFIFGLTIMLVYPAFTDINTEIQAQSDVSNSAKSTLQTSYDAYPTLMDSIFVLVMVLLWITSIVASFQIDSHPIFFVVVIILMIAVIIVAQMLAYSYSESFMDPSISSLATTFPMINFTLTYLHIFALAVGGSILIALYGKNRFAA